MPLQINWEEVYDGTVKSLSAGTDMWGDNSGAFDLSIELNRTKSNKKFDVPIKPIPWSTDYVENVVYTLEWLLRDHRKEEIRFDTEAIVEHIKDFWYQSTQFEGEYTHICYPKELLQFRTQYDSTYAQLISLPPYAMSSFCLAIRERCRQTLWTAWKCFGVDGIYNRVTGKHEYKYTCNRCGSAMPKAVKAFVKLQMLQKKVNNDVSDSPF